MNAETYHSPDEQAPSLQQRLFLWIGRARYATFSALLHLIIIIVGGSAVLIKNIVEPPDFMAEPGSLISSDTSVAPPEATPQMQQNTFTPSAPSASASPSAPTLMAIATNNPSANTFKLDAMPTPTVQVKADALSKTAAPPSPNVGTALSKEIAGKIAGFTGGWAKGGTGSIGKPLKSREFEFTAYLAKYKGGDWDSTVRLEPDGKIWAGSLPNLLFIISKLSKDKIKAHPQVVPLDLASGDIFIQKPPFIWFTGHRDFTLTNDELVNLAEYLRSGGCLWGDSSLPGQRSRFDIAFRREMLRVLQELNPTWQQIPANHPIFTKAYYPEIRTVPPGINFYDEPIYALYGYGGEIAVLYTANDYGDMWQFGIDEKGKMDLSRDEKHRMVAVNESMWYRRELYFRNIDEKSLFDTYKFGTNIIIHLLTRWEEKIRNVPRM
jgi:hypothetical protein